MRAKRAAVLEVEDGATEERYELTCKVVKKKLSYRDHQSRGREANTTAEVVLLVPEQTTQASAFFTAWLPDAADLSPPDEWGRRHPACSEIGLRVADPLHCLIRGALYRGNTLLEKPHIFVMSKKGEDVLLGCIGKKIRLTVLGEKEFDESYDGRAETKAPWNPHR